MSEATFYLRLDPLDKCHLRRARHQGNHCIFLLCPATARASATVAAMLARTSCATHSRMRSAAAAIVAAIVVTFGCLLDGSFGRDCRRGRALRRRCRRSDRLRCCRGCIEACRRCRESATIGDVHDTEEKGVLDDMRTGMLAST